MDGEVAQRPSQCEVRDANLPRVVPLGDRTLLVEWGDAIDPAINKRVHSFATIAERANLPGVRDIVPGYTTVALHYDPRTVSVRRGELPVAALMRQVRDLLGALGEGQIVGPHMRAIEIPVCYGGDEGPDLESLAERHQMSPAQVIELHSAPVYTVFLLGFMPGFPYLGGLDPRLATPRKTQPRTVVPPGSVAIGGAQTGIYPSASPGGWWLLGRTPLKLFDAEATPPCLLSPGNAVRFVPIDRSTLHAMEGL